MHQTFILFEASAIPSDFDSSVFNINILHTLHLGVLNTLGLLLFETE